MGDPERYRTKEEVKKFIVKDPIDNFRKFLFDHKISNEEELEKIGKDAEKEIKASVKFARESPDPADEALFKDVYVENSEGR
jgi:pyruvate dehydrogenase E1 component alpha subunit